MVIENVRTRIKEENLATLIESIKQHGLLQNIGVYKGKNDKYILMYGNRRLEACKKLGYKTISAKVEIITHKDRQLIKNLTENLLRVDNSPEEIGRICSRLINEFKYTEDEISATLTIPRGRVKDALCLYHNLPASCLPKIRFIAGGTKRKGFIPASAAKTVINLYQRYGMSKPDMKDLLEVVRQRDLSNQHLMVITNLMKEGMSCQEALLEVENYTICSVDVVVRKEEMDKLAIKYHTNVAGCLKEIIYGAIKPLKRPSFLNSFIGRCRAKKALTKV